MQQDWVQACVEWIEQEEVATETELSHFELPEMTSELILLKFKELYFSGVVATMELLVFFCRVGIILSLL